MSKPYVPMPLHSAQYIAAEFYRQLVFDRPADAAAFGTELTLYRDDDHEPAEVYAPASYVARVAPVYIIVMEFEMNFPGYDKITAEQKKQYDDAWRSVYDILPTFVQADIDNEKYHDQWDTFSAQDVLDGIRAAEAREAINKAKMH